jgi:hypothetical protein
MKIGGGDEYWKAQVAYANCRLIKRNLGWPNHIEGKFIFQVAPRSIFVQVILAFVSD